MPKYEVTISRAVTITKTYTINADDCSNGSEDERIEIAENSAHDMFNDDIENMIGIYGDWGCEDCDSIETNKIQ